MTLTRLIHNVVDVGAVWPNSVRDVVVDCLKLEEARKVKADGEQNDATDVVPEKKRGGFRTLTTK